MNGSRGKSNKQATTFREFQSYTAGISPISLFLVHSLSCACPPLSLAFTFDLPLLFSQIRGQFRGTVLSGLNEPHPRPNQIRLYVAPCSSVSKLFHFSRKFRFALVSAALNLAFSRVRSWNLLSEWVVWCALQVLHA